MPTATPMSTLAGQHCLLRLAAALRPQDLEVKPLLLEEAARCDLGHRRVQFPRGRRPA